jgi:hypothetical protein
MFSLPAPDHDLWRRCFAPHADTSWLDTEWLFAEMLVYRLMIEAGRYWSTRRDPFAPQKREEMEGGAMWDALEKALAVEGEDEAVLDQLINASLWGNRIDLSLKQTAAMGTHAHDDHLIDDRIEEAVEHLLATAPGRVDFIMDNAGTEQALDLVLVDRLLTLGVASHVTLHVKMHPVLVSDATTEDVHILLNTLDEKGGQPKSLAARIREAVDAGRLSVVPDFFWTTPGRLWELPARIASTFSRAKLVVSKGDLNYRRLTNDAIWPVEAPVTAPLEAFPAPLLALRTLKSDSLIGVDPKVVDRLNRTGPDDWRTSGAYAVAQFAGRD